MRKNILQDMDTVDSLSTILIGEDVYLAILSIFPQIGARIIEGTAR
jgi:hypothetical protein